MEGSETTFVVYKKRFLILFLVSVLQVMTGFQSIQYTIIANIITRYYNVSYQLVTLSALVSVTSNGVLIIPASWILKRYGLRKVFVVCAFLNFVGTTIKCLGVNDTLFWVHFVAQMFIGCSETGGLAMNILVSRIWFPPHEMVRASTVLLMSLTFGSLLSSFIPIVLVPNSKLKDQVAKGLSVLFIGQMMLAFVVFAIAVFFFDKKPKTPPSKSEKDVDTLRAEQPFLKEIFGICTANFIAIIIANGLTALNKGALMLLFNQMLVDTFHNNLYFVSLVSVLFAASKIIASYVSAHFLDITHRYKQLILIISSMSIFLFAIFALGFYLNAKILIIIASILLGFALGPLSVAFINLSAEVTYPTPESISGPLVVFTMGVCLMFTLVYSWIQINYGNVVLIAVMASLMLIVFFISIFIKSDLKRQKQEESKYEMQ